MGGALQRSTDELIRVARRSSPLNWHMYSPGGNAPPLSVMVVPPAVGPAVGKRRTRLMRMNSRPCLSFVKSSALFETSTAWNPAPEGGERHRSAVELSKLASRTVEPKLQRRLPIIDPRCEKCRPRMVNSIPPSTGAWLGRTEVMLIGKWYSKTSLLDEKFWPFELTSTHACPDPGITGETQSTRDLDCHTATTTLAALVATDWNLQKSWPAAFM